ncbi:MAG: hypothetical protein GXO66_08865 [Euryarchaeota archaeon]|nr:hypothetical protein [Euryarchaeota archaeon]
MPASRSAYLTAAGTLIQFAAGLTLAKSVTASAGLGGIVGIMLGAVMILFSFSGVVLTLLFWFKRTAKLAAVLSILFGIAGILSKIGIPGGAVFLLAGILHLWKRF